MTLGVLPTLAGDLIGWEDPAGDPWLGGAPPGYVGEMAAKSQPRGAKGTVGHAYSALNLRLVLASFGLVVCVVLGALAVVADLPVLAVLLGLLAAVALIDLVVVQRRRAARRREEPPGTRHSLFE